MGLTRKSMTGRPSAHVQGRKVFLSAENQVTFPADFVLMISIERCDITLQNEHSYNYQEL